MTPTLSTVTASVGQPLISAAFNANAPVVAGLLANRANFHARDRAGKTALDYVRGTTQDPGAIKCAELLRQHGVR